MEELIRNGIALNLPRNELSNALSYLSIITLKSIRTALFEEAKGKRLCVDSAVLVNRKDTAARPLSAKLSNDVCTLLDCVRHDNNIPRGVLRNGKRDRVTFEAS